MRFFNLLTLGTSLALTTAFVQDEPAYRVKCDDLATLRPSDRTIWNEASSLETTMADAMQSVLAYAEKQGWEEARVLSAQLVLDDRRFYHFTLICRKTNRKGDEVTQRFIARVAPKTRVVNRWQVVYRFPLAPVRSDMTKLDSGLRYHDLRPGDGPEVSSSSRVKVHYVGASLRGDVLFDTYGKGFPESYVVSDALLEGFRQGLVGMRAGGKRKLILPPELAYGEAGLPGVVPPNATLVFDVEVLTVKN